MSEVSGARFVRLEKIKYKQQTNGRSLIGTALLLFLGIFRLAS